VDVDASLLSETDTTHDLLQFKSNFGIFCITSGFYNGETAEGNESGQSDSEIDKAPREQLDGSIKSDEVETDEAQALTWWEARAVRRITD
jgi:hypothetical protein